MLFKIKYLVLVIQSKTTDYNTKIIGIQKKVTDHNHDKSINTPEFDKLTSDTFATRLKQANLARKSDIANSVNKTDFDNKLLGFNKGINSNKIKHVVVDNELNELTKKVEAISTKGVTKDLTNGSKTLNRARYFYSGTRQNHLIYFSYKKYFRFFINTSKVLS